VKQANPIYRAILIIGTCFFFGSLATTALAETCAEVDGGGDECQDAGTVCPTGVSAHECDNICGLAGGCELEIEITAATCTGAASVDCGSGCTSGNLLGQATVSFADPGASCDDREDVVVCQKWVHCDSGDVLCGDCATLATLTSPADSENVSLSCAGTMG